ncbi:XTP/dITP diphosphatase [Paenibacillus athensensis]|uniref:dITP/XTP pyrophosphatase n=1 Tax=Paenibacillus athensensis TaxID=1967502 RepID=A0A4Y8PV09_9BACL|nr:XTP/dITP diphosphatase [Paenibacillus athensensis]MCD1258134.1 XTP/dITP diphosphatase [Paenibacillus athensensis]
MSRPNNMIVIATRNAGKVREFAQLFAPLELKVRSLDDYAELPPIVEDGATFADNARIKAQVIARHLHVPVLADDSGLCVDRLGGAPGVYSARYAGEGASDADNNAKLLRELAQAGGGSESPAAAGEPRLLSPAAFVCALALVDPVANAVIEAEASCEGFIIDEPRGAGGFGYDPLFYVPALARTMAELAPAEKNAISHRAKALRLFLDKLEQSV